jgi:hypothetical protein
MPRKVYPGKVAQFVTVQNRRRDRRRFWILLPGLLMILLDLGVTLYFQPADYWQADYDLTTEKSPLGILLMRFHPAAFLAFMVAYIMVCAGLILRLPTPWNRVIGLALVVGHTAGVYSWLGNRIYWAMIAVFLIIATVTIFSWQQAREHSSNY